MTKLYSLLTPDSPLKQLSDSGSRFKKQLVRFGDWIDPIFPDEVMRMDLARFEAFKRNFESGVVGRISVPLGHPRTPAELVELNKGELISLSIEGDGSKESDGLYGELEVRVTDTADQIRNGTIWDVSISFTDDYVDNENGMHHGPALLHVGLVNNPYIKRMEAFAALADDVKGLFGKKMQYRMLSESSNYKESDMTKVKNDRDFPVEVAYKLGDKEVKQTVKPGEELDVPTEAVEGVQNSIAEAKPTQTPEESAEDKAAREAQAAEEAEKARKEAEDKAAAELAETERLKRELAEKDAKLRDRDIESAYDRGLKAGKIVPAQKEAFTALADALHGQTRDLSDGKSQNLSDLLNAFVEASPVIVNLDDEKGTIEKDSKTDPLKDLPEESKRGLAASGITEEQFAKYGGKESISINELGAKNG